MGTRNYMGSGNREASNVGGSEGLKPNAPDLATLKHLAELGFVGPALALRAIADEFDPIADADLCDEHEWAGYEDCPKCVAEHPEKYMKGWTLIETMIVLAILGILIALFIGGVAQEQKRVAFMAECTEHMKNFECEHMWKEMHPDPQQVIVWAPLNR